MNLKCKEHEIVEVISQISKILGREIDTDRLKFIFSTKGHENPKFEKGYMYIYSFWHDDFYEPLKIGKAGPKSKRRYERSHYDPESSKSCLAGSLVNDEYFSTKYNLNKDNVSSWMHENLQRINIQVPFDVDSGFDYFTLELIEVILHYKYKPYFEGCKSQRAPKNEVDITTLNENGEIMFEFKGFTELANNALNYSVKVAQELGHTFIGCEHILLGLLSDEKMFYFLKFNSKQITLKKVENEIKGIYGIGMPTTLTPNDMTPVCKKVIENALVLGKYAPLGKAGTKELFDSLLNESQCQACKILNLLGFTYNN